jgi:hypothetical protein
MSILSGINNRVRSAVQTVARYSPVARQVVSGAKAARTAYNSARSSFESARTVQTRGYRTAAAATREARQMNVYSGGRPPSAFARVTGPLGVVNNAVSFGRGVGTTISNVRNAVRSGSRQDINTAVQSTLSTARSGLSTVQTGFQAWGARQAHNTYNAALGAFRTAVPGASQDVAAAAARSATRSSFLRATGSTVEATTRQAARSGAREAALTAARQAGPIAQSVAGSGSRAIARAAITDGSQAAVRAAATSAARATASTAGRAAARLVPGVNVAMAAIDTANAVRTLADPNSSTGSRITSVITAAGSIAAATNIPVVSQIGAGVSAVSSFVGSFF